MILFVFHFPAIWLITLNEPWHLIGCFEWFQNGCNKKVNTIALIQSCTVNTIMYSLVQSWYVNCPVGAENQLRSTIWYRFDYRWGHYVKPKGNPLCACPFLSQRQCIDVLIVIGVKIAELRGPNHFLQGKALASNSHAKLCSHFSVWLEEKVLIFSVRCVLFVFSRFNHICEQTRFT